ncbi:unnamed protein product [Oppiella nova]|uniref:Uncharacterized protein n=1 Tax=Oppiella nova TaxID=334625 RepID=A0A7R9LC03_9ACAR|nr:unnamed protein product [Oppiella nova]CAG2162051.1 unnamed protein product [Oppiella nova]
MWSSFALDIEVETKEHNRLLDNVKQLWDRSNDANDGLNCEHIFFSSFVSTFRSFVSIKQNLVVGCVSASYQYGSRVMAGRGAGGVSIGFSPGAGKGLIGG